MTQGENQTELPAAEAEALIPQFVFQRLLNQDHAGCRISLLGSINSKPAVLLVKRAPFSTKGAQLSSLAQSLTNIKNLSNNDIYFWFMSSSISTSQNQEPTDLKVDLIWPCTDKHIKKYSEQPLRMVLETPEIYAKYVKPYIETQRGLDRLGWIYNILDGKSEQEDIIYRSPPSEHGGIVLSPDLNWDRTSSHSLHLLALVERRDIWSFRDLSTSHIPWLKQIRSEIVSAASKKYPDVEADQLKLYVHYQPTYYHFHIHVTHVMFEAGSTQAVGKALGFDNLIGQLEGMAEGKGLKDTALSYHVGEESDLWTRIFKPLKESRTSGFGS